jgi:hypothetical protein
MERLGRDGYSVVNPRADDADDELRLTVSRKVQNSRILIDKLLKLILFYLTIFLKLGFSRSYHVSFTLDNRIVVGTGPLIPLAKIEALPIAAQLPLQSIREELKVKPSLVESMACPDKDKSHQWQFFGQVM